MARLDFSPAVAGYLERHAVDPELAHGLGVRSDRDAIVYPYTTPRGESYTRRRDLADERKITKQPSGEPLILWWPAGRPAPGADVLLTEGEPDALAGLSALNGHPVAVAALPGTEIPADRVTGELAPAETVYLAMDGDEAGRKAANRLARSLQQFTSLKVVRLGEGEDLASRLYREPDREAWLNSALDGAKDAPRVKLRDEPEGYRRKAADRTRDLLARGIDPEKIDPAELLEGVVDYITTYVVLPVIERGEERHEGVIADLLAVWTLHTWTFPAWWATAYLRITSAAPESAKTLLMEVLSSLCRRSWLAVNPSPAVLYRKIAAAQPTLFLDELDNFALDEKRDAVAVLNSGYKPGTPVPRCNDRGELEEFECYCPKAFAAIDVRQMPPALLSRSITIRMEPKHADERVESYIAPDVGPKANDLRDRLRAWSERHVDELRGRRPDLVGLTNRRAEVWWPLLVLGEYVGGEWQERIRRAATVLGAGGDAADRPSQQVQLLTDIRAAFGKDEAIFTKHLLGHLNGLDESPWGARRRGEGLDARGLANMLRPFLIKPKSVRIGEETAKGYQLEQFEDHFRRYQIPSPPDPSLPVTSVTPVTTASLSHADVTDVTDVTATEGPSEDGGCPSHLGNPQAGCRYCEAQSP